MITFVVPAGAVHRISIVAFETKRGETVPGFEI